MNIAKEKIKAEIIKILIYASIGFLISFFISIIFVLFQIKGNSIEINQIAEKDFTFFIFFVLFFGPVME